MITVNKIVVGNGRTRVEILITSLDQGLVIYFGGGLSHVGSVVYGEPYMRDDGSFGCTISMINPLKHKEFIIAMELCETLVTTCGIPVVVIGGIHVENATETEIAEIIENVRNVSAKIIEGCSGK